MLPTITSTIINPHMTTETTSHADLDSLTANIRAHLGFAEKHDDKAEGHRKAAGIHLVKAKKLVEAGEYITPDGNKGSFTQYLRLACDGLSRSRAYELLAIATGTKSVEEVRGHTAARVRKSRTAPVRYVADNAGQTAAAPVTDRSHPDYNWAADPSNYVNGDRLQGMTEEAKVWMRQENAKVQAWIKAQPGYKPFTEPRRIELCQDIEVKLAYVPEADLERVLEYLRLKAGPVDLDAAAWDADDE